VLRRHAGDADRQNGVCRPRAAQLRAHFSVKDAERERPTAVATIEVTKTKRRFTM